MRYLMPLLLGGRVTVQGLQLLPQLLQRPILLTQPLAGLPTSQFLVADMSLQLLELRTALPKLPSHHRKVAPSTTRR